MPLMMITPLPRHFLPPRRFRHWLPIHPASFSCAIDAAIAAGWLLPPHCHYY
jgi:hypothetical protein